MHMLMRIRAVKQLPGSSYIVVTLLLMGLLYVYWSCEVKTEIVLITITQAPPINTEHFPRSSRDVQHLPKNSKSLLANEDQETPSYAQKLVRDLPKFISTTSTSDIPALAGTSKLRDCPQSSGSCRQPIFADDSFIRNCVSNEIVGKIPVQLKTSRIKVSRETSPEDSQERKKSFQKVFETRAWGHGWDSQYRDLNSSGMGATLNWAQESIATLHNIINQLKLHLNIERIRLLDIPCGDMAWMSRFLKTRDDIDYIGIDIVPDIIKHHQQHFAAYPWKFLQRDIVRDGISVTEISTPHLVLCRTLLQHLFFADIVRVLKMFSALASSAGHPVFLLTTSFSGHSLNKELEINEENPGRFRQLNLELPPLYLMPPTCIVRDGPPDVYEGWSHFLGLWQLPLRQIIRRSDFSLSVSSFPFASTDHKIFSCVDWSLKPDSDS